MTRWKLVEFVVAAVACAALVLSPSIVVAAEKVSPRFLEFKVRKRLGIIGPLVSGRDGVWFANLSTDKVGRVTPDGEVDLFALPAKPDDPSTDWVDTYNVQAVTAGVDGTIWVDSAGSAGDTASDDTDGVAQATGAGLLNVPLPTTMGVGDLHGASDGSVWFFANLAHRFRTKLVHANTQGFIAEVEAGRDQLDLELGSLVTSPDGSAWYVALRYGGPLLIVRVAGSTKQVFRVSHAISAAIPDRIPGEGVPAHDLVIGPDGSLWLTVVAQRGWILRVTPQGKVTELAVSTGQGLNSLVAGPDGSMWFADAEQHEIGKVTMHGRVRSYSLPDDVAPVGLMAGTDGNLWFQAGDVGIGRITPTGRVKVFRVGSVPVHGGGALSIGVPPDPFPSRDILASSDGSIWFVARKDHLGRITPTGDVEVFKAPRGSLDPRNALSRLVLGPDQCVWFFGRDGASIVRFDTGIAPG